MTKALSDFALATMDPELATIAAEVFADWERESAGRILSVKEMNDWWDKRLAQFRKQMNDASR
jgi:hypothetical protein